MPINNQLAEDHDANIAELAATATRQAYERALAEGRSVAVAIGDVLYQVSPDGTRTKLKDLKPEIVLKPRKNAIAG